MRGRRKIYADILMNLVFAALPVMMFVVSRSYDFVEGTILGARTFPMLIAAILLIFIIVNIGRAIRNRNVEEEIESSIAEREDEVGTGLLGEFNQFIRVHRVGVALLLLVFYMIMMTFVGFIISSLLFIPSMLYLLEYRRAWKVVVITIAGTLLLHVVFALLLGVSLPIGLVFE